MLVLTLIMMIGALFWRSEDGHMQGFYDLMRRQTRHRTGGVCRRVTALQTRL